MAKHPHPTELRLDRAARMLHVSFDNGERFALSCEYLRVHSPSAEVQGHGPGQRILQTGKSQVNIDEILPVGHYAVLLKFDDGHETGIYSWATLHELGVHQEKFWANYLEAMAQAGASRDAPVGVAAAHGGGCH